jgi:hypothetical protein
MPLLDINNWLDGFKQRAIKLDAIIPVGTPVKSVYGPELADRNGRMPVQFEGEYLGINLESPFPIHLIDSATQNESYNSGDHIAVYWEGRWQTIDEVVGE